MTTPAPSMAEVATTCDGRDITQGLIAPNTLQPSRDSILTDRNLTLLAYEDVLRDDQVAAVFQQRRLAVTSAEWEVKAGGDDRQSRMAADFLTETLRHIGWDAVTDKMLYGVFYGYAVSECLWAKEGNRIVLDALKVRKQRRFGFDGAGRLRLMTMTSPQGELLPERKFWHFATGTDNDDEPYGMGLAHWLYWPVFFKRNGIRLWLIFLDKFGMPTAMGSYPTTATEDEKRKLLQALKMIQTDSGIIVPEGMSIELIEGSRGGQPGYKDMVAHMNAAISKVVLSQESTSNTTIGQYKADAQKDVRDEVVRADSDLINETFNLSVVKWLTQWNFPNAKPPRVTRVTQRSEDLNVRAQRDKTVFEMGFVPSLQSIHDTYGDGWSVAPAPVTPKPQIPAPGKPQAAFSESIDNGIAIADQYALQAAQRAAPAMDALLAPVRHLLASSSSLADFGEGLFDLYSTMDHKPLATLLTGAALAVGLAGRYQVLQEADMLPADHADPVIYGGLPFKEAIDYFRDKINVPTERWDDLLNAQHDVGFMVAGASKAELLVDLRDAVDKANATGTTIATFRKDFDNTVAEHGWEYNGTRAWRTRIIFNTNIFTAYQAGRYTQMTDPDLLESRPYWEYHHSGSQHPRPQHLAWSGKIFPANDPWWTTHYPPNGFGCKCTVFTLAPRDLVRMGRSVDVVPTDDEGGVDRGFAYAPGQTSAQTKGDVAKKLERLPAPLADKVRAELGWS